MNTVVVASCSKCGRQHLSTWAQHRGNNIRDPDCPKGGYCDWAEVKMQMPPFEETCSFCGATYENIGHPLKPGVIMMRVCKCEYESHTMVGSDGSITVTVRKPATKEAISAAVASAADLDLVTMTREQLLQECEKLRAGIRKHRDASGHDLCWHVPELWDLLPEKIEPRPVVPPKDEFLRRCAIYRDSLTPAQTDEDYEKFWETNGDDRWTLRVPGMSPMCIVEKTNGSFRWEFRSEGPNSYGPIVIGREIEFEEAKKVVLTFLKKRLEQGRKR